MLFEGHEGPVSSLHQSIPEELVSGSWDGYDTLRFIISIAQQKYGMLRQAKLSIL